jgi:long-subunit fatty acid transport protein
MKKSFIVLAALMMTIGEAWAGGILTNTNQSILFLKNPARDAAIGLDGVYSNPAGVAFMPQGFHIAFNWQYAHQTRTVTSVSPVYMLGKKNNGNDKKIFEGVADAPCIPSLQFAWNKGDWSIQANLSVPGGGGSCEFADGLGSFERVVGGIASMLQPLGAQGYDMNGYMKGRQYYFGVQVGAAYKIHPNLSVYGGLRLLYGDATYKAKISNIQVKTEGGYVDFADFMTYSSTTVNNALDKVTAGIAQYEAAGAQVPAELIAQKAQLEGTKEGLTQLQKYAQGVNLLCNQDGLGIAPVIGVDWKYKNFNFAAKYEFKTQLRMKNESTVNEASAIDAVNKYKDGEKVNEDMPALLTVGAQWKPIEVVSLNLGWHHYFDKNVNWYNNSQDLLKHDTNEFLAGVEWDITNKLNVSMGGQLTRYGLTDEYMNDISFVVNSYSIGLGASYKVADNVTLSAAYFQTNYSNYDKTAPATEAIQYKETYTRTNRVLGLGVQVDF